jgi:hypothetical protein
MATFVLNQAFVVEHCYKCGVAFGLPTELYETAKRKGPDRTFYCPNGHGQSYIKSEADKLREELANEKRRRQWAEEDARRQRQDAEHFKKSRDAYKGSVTKLKKRAAAGMCPCCNRHFVNLERHMATKHPSFTKEEAGS